MIIIFCHHYEFNMMLLVESNSNFCDLSLVQGEHHSSGFVTKNESLKSLKSNALLNVFYRAVDVIFFFFLKHFYFKINTHQITTIVLLMEKKQIPQNVIK